MSMVVVQCFNCSAVLELDEGFRGGVCRCSSCGSLLQVPRGERETGRKPRPAAPPKIPSGEKEPVHPALTPAESGAKEASQQPPQTQIPSTNQTSLEQLGEADAASRQSNPEEQAAALAAAVTSSNLRRIQQTRPIAAAIRKPPKKASGSPPHRDVKPAGGKPNPPAIHELRRNTAMLWAAFILIAIIASVVIVSMLMWFWNGRVT